MLPTLCVPESSYPNLLRHTKTEGTKATEVFINRPGTESEATMKTSVAFVYICLRRENQSFCLISWR